ncbi:MAG TPA: hypothetical protein VM580_29150 [Labilithrix sp.]|nr:hypothetical protein [Labilithrix sp.]
MVLTPAEPADVTAVYDQIGNACNDSVVTRTFVAVSRIDANTLWSTPETDPAGLSSPKRTGGWSELLAVSKFSFEGLTDNVQTTSPEQSTRCAAARDILTPISRDDRQLFTNVLLYAGEHAHLDAFPASGIVGAPVDAPVRLKGYIVVSSGIRKDSGPDVVYRDVTTQHLPIYVACERPFRVVREVRSLAVNEASDLDLSTCQLDDGGENYSCIFERVEHVANNRCTFVATDTLYRAADGTEQRLSIGGHLESNDAEPVRYRITVDRYAFHAK